MASDPRWRYLRADEHARWQKFLGGYTAQDAALAQQRWPVARKIVAAMHDAGVTILAGTDSPMPGVYPGFSLHEELALLVESGLTPVEALRAATLAPAEFLGIAGTTGSVAVGKRADLCCSMRIQQKIFAIPSASMPWFSTAGCCDAQTLMRCWSKQRGRSADVLSGAWPAHTVRTHATEDRPMQKRTRGALTNTCMRLQRLRPCAFTQPVVAPETPPHTAPASWRPRR